MIDFTSIQILCHLKKCFLESWGLICVLKFEYQVDPKYSNLNTYSKWTAHILIPTKVNLGIQIWIPALNKVLILE